MHTNTPHSSAPTKLTLFLLVALGTLFHASAAELPAHYQEWHCPTDTPRCNELWGYTGFGKLNLTQSVRALLGRPALTYFDQYSRPNDDTPAGSNPVLLLEKEVGKARALELLQRDRANRYVNRESLIHVTQDLIASEKTFFEVATMTIAITHPARTSTPDNGFSVGFIALLESTSGRYERAPETGNFEFIIEPQEGTRKITKFKTFYQNGATPSSPILEKMGTLSRSMKVVDQLQEGRHRVRLAIRGPDGLEFNSCWVEFRLPWTGPPSLDCERHKFPPLVLARSNIPKKQMDPFRYHKPNLGEPCINEYVGNQGLSTNSLIGAIFRSAGTCIDCHSSIRAPRSTSDFLCPEPESVPAKEESTLGLPTQPNLISYWIHRYFMDPKIDNVPKKSLGMKKDLDQIIKQYCRQEQIEIWEYKKRKMKSITQVINAWVKDYNNPNSLDFNQVCGFSAESN